MNDLPLPQVDVLLVSTLYLMTRYNAHRCPCVARAMAQLLDLLSREADGASSSTLRAACAQLELDWRALTRGFQAVGPGRH